jgi:peptide-methionine (S)-S-oxide reductase
MGIISKLGFGGSCHWCTEAIFQSLKGVVEVKQGWISSQGQASSFSEGVLVCFDQNVISLNTLIAIHLHTHSCTSGHHMRSKYRSAVYTFDDEQAACAREALSVLQREFESPIITGIIPFVDFKLNSDAYLNYYYSNPEKPFCENVVNPKLRVLLAQFSGKVDSGKLKDLR